MERSAEKVRIMRKVEGASWRRNLPTAFEVCVVVVATACTMAAIFAAFVVTSSPIDPVALVLPRYLASGTENRKLECVEKLGEGLVQGPEDVVEARDGSLVVTTRDGWVKKVWSNGTVQSWKHVGGYPCGLALGVHGEIIVADPVRGLLNVTEDDEVRVVTNQAEGIAFTFADSVTVARNGQIYFTDASSEHSMHSWHLDVLEARPHGRMLNFDPITGRTTVLMGGLGFANGIALSPKEDFLVVCESWKYRCVRYWLEGESKGTSETFVDNLPGFPDNIHLHAPSQTFWLGVVGGRSWLIDLTHKTPFLKHFFARYWHRVKPFNFARADLIAVNLEGELVERYQDPRGSRLSFATGAVIKDNYLYIGSLTQNFLGRLSLDMQDCSSLHFSHWPLY
ncbi:hypothetical protein KC19_9G009800 [Ceratodon purpureus]|uniref:Strictosidine synthase conserved region domain-containing protein n=1 Tax=Ceratodon purpureus TaxID=3225 RepID=A0A8T0GQ82_CERPU|nr:hypothetical protein KC19_9G009800 [Ceratodon purpureus]